MARKYVIICLKRSNYPDQKVYWRKNYAGYTEYLEEAGIYDSIELDGAAGKNGDWIVEPYSTIQLGKIILEITDEELEINPQWREYMEMHKNEL